MDFAIFNSHYFTFLKKMKNIQRSPEPVGSERHLLEIKFTDDDMSIRNRKPLQSTKGQVRR